VFVWNFWDVSSVRCFCFMHCVYIKGYYAIFVCFKQNAFVLCTVFNAKCLHWIVLYCIAVLLLLCEDQNSPNRMFTFIMWHALSYLFLSRHVFYFSVIVIYVLMVATFNYLVIFLYIITVSYSCNLIYVFII